MNKNDVLKKINEKLHLLKVKYPIKELGVFGSVVRGDKRKGSDVDILVEFSKPIGFFGFIQLEDELSRIVGEKVDLVSKKAIKPAVRESILKETLYV